MSLKGVFGYYSLAAYTLKVENLPEQLMKGIPKYPLVGTTLIGRLAIDLTQQGKSLGGMLLINATKNSFEQSKKIGSLAVVVDALDEKAKKFYEHYGFISLPEKPLKLVMSMKTVAKRYG